MPVYTSPNGFVPVHRRDGMPYSGAMREYPIATGYNSQLRQGDLVRVTTAGALDLVTDTDTIPTTTGGFIGVFMGCAFTDAALGRTYRTYWTAGTAATNIVAMVADDPKLVFRAVYVSSGVTVSAQTRAATIGKNVGVIQNTTKTKTSDIAIAGAATTATLPFRVIDVDPDSAATLTTYTALFVTYGIGVHAYDCIAPT